jgi:erythromycin esterase-like protein
LKNYNEKRRYLVKNNGLQGDTYYIAIDPDEAATLALKNECFTYISRKNQTSKDRLQTLIKLSKKEETIQKVKEYFRITSIVETNFDVC